MTDDAPPSLVEQATALADRLGFARSCTPEVGRLLAVLAAGVRPGAVGEIGTGCGVGTAWMAGSLGLETQLVTIDHDPTRTAVLRELFAASPQVRLTEGNWRDLLPRGPFDLLFVDVADAKQGDPTLVVDALRRGGMVVLDDFSPKGQEPAALRGKPDPVRDAWLRHPRLRATELQVGSSMVVILATRVA